MEASVQQTDIIGLSLADETASMAFAQKMAEALAENKLWQKGLVIYLLGDLGAGKSFLARNLIQTFAPEQKVKSPTYTLVESYPLELEEESFTVHHFDLYRLCDPEELEFLGVRDLLTPPFLALIEWPQKGGDWTPKADLVVTLQPIDVAGNLGRQLQIQAASKAGQKLLMVLKLD